MPREDALADTKSSGVGSAGPSQTLAVEPSTFAEPAADAAIIDALFDSTPPEPSPARPETARTVVDDLESRDFDIPIPLNDRVLSFVELFTGRLKGYLEEGLSRGGRYLPMVHAIFRAEGVPLDLAYVPLIESAFKPSALSRAKARGIWQFMQGTGLENGLRHDWYIDERADPEKATRAAAKYLKFLHEKFGDWHLALASYNGGWGRVQRAMRRTGRDDFWALSAQPRALPRETRDYVPLILAAVIVARSPAQYGLTVSPVVDAPFEVVNLTAPTDLRHVADWAQTTLEAIQDLNPELRRWATPARESSYPLRVPAGTAERVRAEAASAEVGASTAPFAFYVVRKGEAVASIAKKLRVTRADLLEANYLTARARLVAGQRLIVPRAPDFIDSKGQPDVQLAVAAVSGPDPVAAAAEHPRPQLGHGTSRVHRVKRGETLFSIARLYRTTVTAIREWNRLGGTTIRVGQRLTIRSGATSQAD
jgi:membrane-bound lytic murein transglycosylase D